MRANGDATKVPSLYVINTVEWAHLHPLKLFCINYISLNFSLKC